MAFPYSFLAGQLFEEANQINYLPTLPTGIPLPNCEKKDQNKFTHDPYVCLGGGGCCCFLESVVHKTVPTHQEVSKKH